MEKDNQTFKGLNTEEVQQRIAEGKVNAASTVKTKSIKQIFIDNIFTVFNGINVFLFILLMLVGSYKNLLFIGVVLFNTVIGIVQEIRSKQSVDKLTILTESKQNVLRDGKTVQLSKDEIVLDDIILLSRGSQVPADCIVVDGSCHANESLLTGESDLIPKEIGDELLSGSFISAGRCYGRVNRVGADSYAAKINNEAKYIKKNNSQILSSFNFIIKICSAIIFPLGALLFAVKYFVHHQPLNDTVVSTVGALTGMIPSGMILLTSTVLAVSVIRLAKKKVLVNEMYCIETLARVDVLCLDKTGTLTAEKMTVSDVIPLNCERSDAMTALASIASVDEVNATAQAIGSFTKDTSPLSCLAFTPFSSETKWSGGNFSNGKAYIMGAVEFVFSNKEKYAEVYRAIEAITDTVRILAVAQADTPIRDKTLPDDRTPMGLVLIKDQLRDNVQDTVRYFKEQGVALKVISGDSVHTVQQIASDCGIEGAENAVDMSTVKTDAELKEAALRCSVFGRVTPPQKKKLVLALKAKGHKVAMTGDGVNDVLALKEADCSVAMAAGSEAARNVSQLVLVNNDFASMPQVVVEGRRSINNIERSSSLYLVKTMYSIILSLFFLFSHHIYPFEPIQLSLIGALTVGFPSFVLALQPNHNIVRGNFTFNIITRAAPAALCIAMNVILSAALSTALGITQDELSTMAVYITSLVCLLLIVRLSIPFNALRGGMLAISIAGLIIAVTFFGSFFMLTALSTNALILLCCSAVFFTVLFNVLYHIADKQIEKFKRLPKKKKSQTT